MTSSARGGAGGQWAAPPRQGPLPPWSYRKLGDCRGGRRQRRWRRRTEATPRRRRVGCMGAGREGERRGGGALRSRQPRGLTELGARPAMFQGRRTRRGTTVHTVTRPPSCGLSAEYSAFCPRFRPFERIPQEPHWFFFVFSEIHKIPEIVLVRLASAVIMDRGVAARHASPGRHTVGNGRPEKARHGGGGRAVGESHP